MAISISKDARNNESNSISFNVAGLLEKMVEMVWFFLSLILFIVLGPFSGPIALLALLQVGCEDNDLVSPESAI